MIDTDPIRHKDWHRSDDHHAINIRTILTVLKGFWKEQVRTQEQGKAIQQRENKRRD